MCPGNSALGAATLKPYLIGYNSCKESLYEQSENSRNTEDKVVGHWRKAKRKLHISLFKLETRLQFQNVCLNRIDQLFFLDAQASLAPTHVCLSVGRSHFRNSKLSASLVALPEKLKKGDPKYFSILGMSRIS